MQYQIYRVILLNGARFLLSIFLDISGIVRQMKTLRGKAVGFPEGQTPRFSNDQYLDHPKVCLVDTFYFWTFRSLLRLAVDMCQDFKTSRNVYRYLPTGSVVSGINPLLGLHKVMAFRFLQVEYLHYSNQYEGVLPYRNSLAAGGFSSVFHAR